MASGALPPGLPAIEIEGEHYWDGGLVSNTPFQWLVTNTRVTEERLPDALVFQVDLWSARGDFPRSMAEVTTRQKEIQYSSRTRAFTDFVKRLHKVESSVAALLEQLPEEFKRSEEAKFWPRSRNATLTTSCTSSIAREATKATRKTMSSPGCPWRSIGVRATRHHAHAAPSGGARARRQRKDSPSSTLPVTAIELPAGGGALPSQCPNLAPKMG